MPAGQKHYHSSYSTRSAIKEDAKASAAELVYGEPLRLPGEMFLPDDKENIDLTKFIDRIRLFAQKLQPVATSRHNNKNTFVFKDLSTTRHVFVRDDTVRGALQPAFTGPYEVIERGDKVFKLNVKGKTTTVSIDRLKPAYMMTETNNTPNVENDNRPSITTRSGRKVRFPDYYRP
ncbi:uncharacterized protein LOC125490058 [Plutella xylostella]|uniref:uncharacterized protein LOC125490058 n=1 Tax=Plutella xylostella TaxID=51655 RepID=UPI0020329F75|nr:uncharacterized protein LOC125490058 [Plutella xylostella]